MQGNADDPLAGEGRSTPRDLKEVVLYGVARSRYIVATTGILAFSIALAFAASIPNNYTATALLRYTPGLRELRMAPEASLGAEVSGVPLSIAAELLLLTDLKTFRNVALSQGVEEILIPADPTQYDTEVTSSPVRWLHRLQKEMIELRAPKDFSADAPLSLEAASKRLLASTSFDPMPRSSVIRVTHTSSSKERSVERLNLILDECVERHREQYRREELFVRSQDREASLYDQLQTAKEEFRNYRVECGVEDFEASFARAQERIAALEMQVSDAENAHASNESELEFLRDQAESVEKELEHVEPAVQLNSRRHAVLFGQREEAAIDLILLAADTTLSFGEKEQRERSLRLRIEEYDKRLAETDPMVVERAEERTLVPNPAWFALERQISQIAGAQRATTSRLKWLRAELTEQRAKLEHIRGCEETHVYMKGVVVELAIDFRAAAARNEEIEDLNRLDEAGTSNLSRYLEPRKPDGKDGPPRGVIAIGGLVGGLLLGFAIAIVRQLAESRIRYPRTVEREFGLRVLCIVPEIRNLRTLHKRTVAPGR